MKYKIDYLIVIEGNNDESYLSSFISSFYFVINGYDINEEKIKFLKEVEKVRKIILLLDPDEAGKNIRNKLHNYLNNFIDVEVNLLKCHKNNKHGIKECEKEELIKVLSPYFVNDINKGNIEYIDLFNKSESELEKIRDKYCIMKVNKKKMVKYLNCLNVRKEDL
ncbi:MAG: toprim domain-containing protein [Bacilli bacterium]